MSKPRLLFILKHRQAGPYGAWNYRPDGYQLSSGLIVSATQLVASLNAAGVEAKVVEVVDNNSIDREVTAYRPTHAIIEAFWVVPSKFDVLQLRHPTVKWVVRNHSKTEFLAGEGNAIGWALDYLRRGVILACNSPEATTDFTRLCQSIGLPTDRVWYLPNSYFMPAFKQPHPLTTWWRKVLRKANLGRVLDLKKNGILQVGCFGAIRPLKNHLNQAVAAIVAADALGLRLEFHINGTRVEGKADSILKNIRELFNRSTNHVLIEHEWLDHPTFTRLIAAMDVVCQVSLSETFNIVTADAVVHGVPVVTSKEIPWLDREFDANPGDVDDIANTIEHTVLNGGRGRLALEQKVRLSAYCDASVRRWLAFARSRLWSE